MTVAGAAGDRRSEPVRVTDLCVSLAGGAKVVEDVSLRLQAGKVTCLVGESGSGKTTVSLALLGHARRGAKIVAGTVDVLDEDILSLGRAPLRRVRGSVVAYIPQDPSAALNPALRIGMQLREVLEQHPDKWPPQTHPERLGQALAEVALPSDPEFLRRYPHQLSGGQQQRIAIAMAFIGRPDVLVCDEPTTGLDVTTQARVLETVGELARAHSVATLYVTHDLAVVAEIADRVLVMYAGRIVETGPRTKIFASPRHPYTQGLLAALPDIARLRALRGIEGRAPQPGARPLGCAFAPRCPLAVSACHDRVPLLREVAGDHSAACIRLEETAHRPAEDVPPVALEKSDAEGGARLTVSNLDAWYASTPVLFEAELALGAGDCLAVVGESGSGKTTLARAIAGLHPHYRGEVRLGGDPLSAAARDRSDQARGQIQYVFQSPYASLNLRTSIGHSIEQPLRTFFGMGRRERAEAVAAALEQVRLPSDLADRFPDELSGGERQRVAIARALAARPSFLICDEITSALDVSVQAAIVDLLAELRTRYRVGLLFITHNLALVRTISERVIVMRAGRMVESGSTGEIFSAPKDSYTSELLAATPSVRGAEA